MKDDNIERNTKLRLERLKSAFFQLKEVATSLKKCHLKRG